MGNYGECGNQRHHEVVAGAGQKVHLQKAPAATGYFSPPSAVGGSVGDVGLLVGVGSAVGSAVGDSVS